MSIVIIIVKVSFEKGLIGIVVSLQDIALGALRVYIALSQRRVYQQNVIPLLLALLRAQLLG